MASTLADRVRGLSSAPAPAPPSGPRRSVPALEAALGGRWHQQDSLACFVVERRYDAGTPYGREPIAALAARLEEGSSEAPLVAGGARARPPFVFFDLETTGLGGGAGTQAFLAGCGAFDGAGGFRTRQFVLVRHADERAFLTVVAGELAGAGALVSFNGKAFDMPLFEMRCLFHRLEWTGGAMPHVDVLYPARRFWRRGAGGVPGQDDASRETGDGGADCSLMALEARVLGARRSGDVPGCEIPSRYFQFVRTGDPAPLVPVLEHNRLDLLSLAGLTARLLHLVRLGPSAAGSAREAFALGRLYQRAGLDLNARTAYSQAVTLDSSSKAARRGSAGRPGAQGPAIAVEALRSLAVLARRAREFDEAAACWRDLLQAAGCPPRVAREANEALAVHHEHRARDLGAARTFALRSLDGALRPASRQAVQHRLARLENKMDQVRGSRLEPQLNLET